MVLDFDWSLVEENSDTWVLQQLGASHIFQRLLSEGKGSHSAESMLQLCFETLACPSCPEKNIALS